MDGAVIRLLFFSLFLCATVLYPGTATVNNQQREWNDPFAMFSNESLAAMTPSTPLPEDVNCHVEIRVMETVGGQCVRFGRSRMWGCQSGIHMELSQECERRHRRRPRTN